jgi:phosphatidylglycerophosphate synthase
MSTPCTPVWDFEVLLCGPPCYTYTDFYGNYDFIFNVCVPLLINICVNLILIIRVIKGKMSHQPRINWRRHRKMILQFWAISTLHLALWSPLVSVSLIQMTVNPSFMADQYTTLEYILYYMPFLLPITCLFGMPELVNKIMNFNWKRRSNVVAIGDLPGARQRAPNITVQ